MTATELAPFISISALLETLTSSLTSTLSSLPDPTNLHPPADGISLLDVKNELFLSYLQHLVFLILLKLRNARASSAAAAGAADHHDATGATAEAAENEKEEEEKAGTLDEKVVRKLVECRVYLEKGIRPLEARLKYQLDKVLRAADDDDVVVRLEAGKGNGDGDGDGKKKKKGMISREDSRSGDGSEDGESDVSSEEDDEEENKSTQPTPPTIEIDDLSYRPNPSSLLRPSQPSSTTTTNKPFSSSNSKNNNIYRPPRIQPISLPTVTPPTQKTKKPPYKSATLDEFITTELSSAPLAEPSIGSTIMAGGRRNKTQREREAEAERQRYEEANFVRLPGQTKKERRRLGGKAGREGGGGYGGEEWRGLDRGVERIERLTARRKGSGLLDGGRMGRKRGLDGEGMPDQDTDGGKGNDANFRFGERLEKKRRLLGRTNRRKGGGS